MLHCWAVPNLITLLTHILSYNLDELLPILKACWCIPCLFKLLRCSQSWKKCWRIPCRITSLSCSWSYKITETHLDLLQEWVFPKPKTLLMYILCYNTAEMFSQSWKNAEEDFVMLHCWAVPNLITLLTHILSYNLAEFSPILKHCWYIPWLIKLLRCSQCWKKRCCILCRITLLSCSWSYKITETHLDLLQEWVIPKRKTLLMYFLSYNTAEMFPILQKCWRILCHVTLLSCS